MDFTAQVLILTSELDFATDQVCRELANQGVSFLRLNRERLAESRFELDPVSPRLTCRHDGDTWIVGKELKSVWWRQGTFDRNIAGAGALDHQMERTQWSAFMRSMMVFENAKWMNHPSTVYRAETKAVQLAEAAKIGFSVPSTVMTNDPDCLPVASPTHAVAIKSIDTLLLRDGDDQLFGYTKIMPWSSAAVPDLQSLPLTAQQALLNKLDLRITVVGDRLWSTAIKSGGAGIDGDWRLTRKDDLQIVDYDLSQDDADQCRKIVSELGLRYGAIDLAVADGKTWFIEINPTGEWGWIDSKERPIAKTIAESLACPH